MHIVGPSHMQTPSCGSKILFSICSWLNSRMGNPGLWRANCVFIEKYPRISLPTQLKPMLFKSQLYSWSGVFVSAASRIAL